MRIRISFLLNLIGPYTRRVRGTRGSHLLDINNITGIHRYRTDKVRTGCGDAGDRDIDVRVLCHIVKTECTRFASTRCGRNVHIDSAQGRITRNAHIGNSERLGGIIPGRRSIRIVIIERAIAAHVAGCHSRHNGAGRNDGRRGRPDKGAGVIEGKHLPCRSGRRRKRERIVRRPGRAGCHGGGVSEGVLENERASSDAMRLSRSRRGKTERNYAGREQCEYSFHSFDK
jgi:hypothetical protein